MKTTVFFFLLLYWSHAFAQPTRGTFLPGLDLNYNSSTQTYNSNASVPIPGKVTTDNFSINPSAGFFVTDHWLVGINADYTASTNKDTFHGPYVLSPKTSSRSIGPYARYYSRIGEKVFFFLQGEISWGKGKQTLSNADSTLTAANNSTAFFKTGIRPGIVYFITRRIGMEISLGFIGYTRMKASNDDFNTGISNTTSDFGITINNSTVNVGVRYYLSKKE